MKLLRTSNAALSRLKLHCLRAAGTERHRPSEATMTALLLDGLNPRPIAESGIREGAGVDAAVKETLLDRFRCYLDSIEEAPEEPDAAGAEADLFTVFVELAAVRNEVRTESRLVKEALDRVPRRLRHPAVEPRHAGTGVEARAGRSSRNAGGRCCGHCCSNCWTCATGWPPGCSRPPRRRRAGSSAGATAAQAEPESWREGLGITLRRLDRILAERRVVRIEMIGRRFDPRMGRVVGTSAGRDASAPGIVVEEVSAGFLWDDELLRAAEVIVNKAGTEQRRLRDDGRDRRHRPGNDKFRDRAVPGRPAGNPGR